MLTCPKCQSTYPDDASFCARDGIALTIIGQIEVDSIDDDWATAISPPPEDLDLVLDLEEDLNAVEITHEEAETPTNEKLQRIEPLAETMPLEALGEEDTEFSLQGAGWALPIGSMVGEYRIEQKIAEGGMGIVYAAIQPLIGKRVAVKILHPRFAKDANSVERFIQEARAVNTIGHPNIVDIFAFNQLSTDRHYLVMELLEGEDLSRLLKRKKRLPLSDAVPILIQVAQALFAAHQKGVVHRDLKPDNIFLLNSKNNPGATRIKLLDFGVAKLLDDEKQSRMTAGGIVGTLNYMSPEQCSGGIVDGLSDLYSLAVLTYECIVGEVPFSGPYLEVITAHLQKPPPPFPQDLELGFVKQELETLLLQSLAKEREKRPKNVLLFAEELEKIAIASGQYTPPVLSTGAHAAVLSQSLKLAAISTYAGEQPPSLPSSGYPEAQTNRKPTTISSSAGEISSRQNQKKTVFLSGENASALSRILPFIGGVAAAVGIALLVAFIYQSQQKKPEQAVPTPTSRPIVPILLTTLPPQGDVFDQENFLLGQAPFSIDPSQVKSVTIRWRGHFPTPITLEDVSEDTLTISPNLSSHEKDEALLLQLKDKKLGLDPGAMAPIHFIHEDLNLARCEDCHAAELSLDAFLCQSCHRKGKKDTSLDAKNRKQCNFCHLEDFRPRKRRFHRPPL